ncbi:MAG: ATP synthase subunit I [Burkholderiales bacterium]|nr:ATP synthase subunit I [Burkholderiales bacterium]
MAIAPDPLAERTQRWAKWEDEAAEPAHKTLTREEARALRARQPSLSPWRVVVAQAALGAVSALVAWFVGGKAAVAWSVLYGAACVVLPGVLMARGMTSRLSSLSLGASAVSFMLWESVKIAVSVAMLALAPKLVPALSWPALLVGLVLCMQMYWLALLWRPSPRSGPTKV